MSEHNWKVFDWWATGFWSQSYVRELEREGWEIYQVNTSSRNYNASIVVRRPL